MIALHPHYVTDEQGTRLAVMLPAQEFARLLEALEMVEDIEAYDLAKGDGGGTVPFEQFMASLDG